MASSDDSGASPSDDSGASPSDDSGASPSDDAPWPSADPVDPTSEELVRSNARLRVLAEVSHAFAMVVTDYQQLLEKIARKTADIVGDGCSVTLITADGETMVNAANAHRDASLELDYRAYLNGVGVSKTSSASVSATVARTGEPKLVAEIDPGEMVARADERLKPLVQRLNVHGFVVVPIRARQRVIGTLSAVRSGPGRGYTVEDVTLMQDLADRAGLAIENARLYDDLERRVGQRTAELETANAELETFCYSVAHDLRAPLRSIDGFSQALLEDCAAQLDPQGKQYLDRVRGAAQRMGTLIDDLLHLSRVTRAELRRGPVDLSALAEDVVAALRESQPERDVQTVIEPGLHVDADPKLVEIALTNLLGNAWKFTSKRADARIELGASRTESPIVFRVTDNGAGFDPKYADRLFGVFQRLHGAHEFEGTGIGLATVQRIVRRHGGRIWAEAELDQGATFRFTLQGEARPSHWAV